MKTLRCVPNRKTFSRLAALAVFASVLPVTAIAEQPAYTMTVIKDAAQGRKIMAGNVESALARLEKRPALPSQRFYRQTNLCVAYTISGQLDEAAGACDAALTTIEDRAAGTTGQSRSTTERENLRYLAVALTNRGVLYALNNELAEARDAFEQADALEVRMAQPQLNLARLESDKQPDA